MDRLVLVTFQFPSMLVPEAQHISLVGPFNRWAPTVHRLTKAGNWWWTIRVYLPPG